MGNPSLKIGGLNRYCKDLFENQRIDGHDVFIIFPESFFQSKRPHIVKKSINVFAIRDALPMAITYGIDDPERFMVAAQSSSYESFLINIHPDVIHVHSIQGIHKEFFETAKKLDIPMVFTTHDYYPICPRCVLLNSDGKICTTPGSASCAICNQGAGLSANKQRIVQSDLYQNLKNSSIIRRLKAHMAKKIRMETGTNEIIDKIIDINEGRKENKKEGEFASLREYYNTIMHCMSFIHCNSSVTLRQYYQFYPDIPMKVIPIAHSGLSRTVHERKRTHTLNISYMGGMSAHKGYHVFMDAIQKLNQQVPSGWELWLYGGEYIRQYNDEKIHYKGLFTSDEEEEVWDNTDLLIVCSQCFETFGFIVLEALSRGIPVLCSDLVGSKDLVMDIDKSLVFQHDNVEELAEKMERFLDTIYYRNICNKIDTADIEVEMKLHSRTITNLYKKIIAY